MDYISSLMVNKLLDKVKGGNMDPKNSNHGYTCVGECQHYINATNILREWLEALNDKVEMQVKDENKEWFLKLIDKTIKEVG
jgi:hypothetical protein